MRRGYFAYWNEVFLSVVCVRTISIFGELFNGGVLTVVLSNFGLVVSLLLRHNDINRKMKKSYSIKHIAEPESKELFL